MNSQLFLTNPGLTLNDTRDEIKIYLKIGRSHLSEHYSNTDFNKNLFIKPKLFEMRKFHSSIYFSHVGLMMDPGMSIGIRPN